MPVRRGCRVSKPPIFIVGAPRSGTTLLRNMLNRHPTLAICGETQFHRHVYSRRRAFGSLANPKNRERLVHEYLSTDRIKRLGMDLSKLREKLMREGDSYRAVFTCVMEHYAESQGKQRCGEKTPQHAVFTETLCDWYPGATIIHLLRDPRDVVASLQRMPWASDSVVTNAKVWVSQNVAAQRSSHRSGYLLVRYETLVNRPEEELARICAHLDEEYSPLMLVPQEESIIYSERSKRSQMVVTTERLGKWKGQLTKEEVALIEWAAGEKLGVFEYQAAVRPPSRLAIARGLAFAVFDAARRRINYFPAVLYRLLWPTKLANEEFWVFRRIREQDRDAIASDPMLSGSKQSSSATNRADNL